MSPSRGHSRIVSCSSATLTSWSRASSSPLLPTRFTMPLSTSGASTRSRPDGFRRPWTRPMPGAFSENTLSEKAPGIGLVHGRLNPSGRLRVLAPDVDKGMVNLVGNSGDDDALDQLVRVALEQLTILECPRLGLIGVHDQIGGPGGAEK